MTLHNSPSTDPEQDSAPRGGTRAHRAVDCGKRFSIHYFLPCPLDQDLAARLPHTELTVQPFSEYVPGAKDHLFMKNGGEWYAAGVCGENRLVVTFGQATEEEAREAIAEIERCLEAEGCGPIVAD